MLSCVTGVGRGQFPVEDKFRNENGRKYVGHQTDDQRDREALDRPLPEEKQNGAGNDGGYVGIDNGQQALCRNPVSTAGTTAFPARNSSRMRSKIRTLLSTAIPMVRIMPAIPGRVRTASK